jgi:hypothetical protein
MLCRVTSAAVMRKPRNQPVRIMRYAALVLSEDKDVYYRTDPHVDLIPFLLAKSALCRCGKLSERTLEKLSLCDDIAIVMFAFVFLVCSEKSKDQCVCLRLSEVRLIHQLNIEEPPSTP